MGVSGCERVSAPGSESIALGHALVCPGVSLGGDQLGGLPAWGPLGLNLLSGCRVCVQSYQQASSKKDYPEDDLFVPHVVDALWGMPWDTVATAAAGHWLSEPDTCDAGCPAS